MGGKGGSKKKGGGSKANSPLRDVEESAYGNDDDDNAADMRGNQREEAERAEQRHGELMSKFEALITLMTAAASTTAAANAAALSSAEGGTAHQALISSIDKQREATERLERRLVGDSTTTSLADAVSKAVADRIAAVEVTPNPGNPTSVQDVQTVAEAVGTAIATRLAALDAERDKATKERYDHLLQQVVDSVSNRSTATSSNASSTSSGSGGATTLAAARGLHFGSMQSPFTPRFSPLANNTSSTMSGGGTVASDSQGVATGANSTPLGDRPNPSVPPPPPQPAPSIHGNSGITAALLKAMQTPVPRLKSLSKAHVMAFDKDLDEFNREFIRVDPSMIRSASSCMSQDDLDIVAAHLSGLAGPAAGATAYFCNLADADQRGALFSPCTMLRRRPRSRRGQRNFQLCCHPLTCRLSTLIIEQ